MGVKLGFQKLQFKFCFFFLQSYRMFLFIFIPQDKHDGNENKGSTDNREGVMKQKILCICQYTDDAVFRQICKKGLGEIDNENSVNNGDKIKTDHKVYYKLKILFAIRKAADQHIINPIGSHNLKNPVTDIVNNQLFENVFRILIISSCYSK